MAGGSGRGPVGQVRFELAQSGPQHQRQHRVRSDAQVTGQTALVEAEQALGAPDLARAVEETVVGQAATPAVQPCQVGGEMMDCTVTIDSLTRTHSRSK